MFDGQERPNAARFVFLDPRARDFYLDWDRIARDVVATLRSAAGRNPYDRDLTDLVGELSTRSEEFRQHWARHDVRFHISGVKHFHHRDVGDLELNYERLEVVFDTDLTIFTYTADPGTRSAEALSLLGSLAATTTAGKNVTGALTPMGSGRGSRPGHDKALPAPRGWRLEGHDVAASVATAFERPLRAPPGLEPEKRAEQVIRHAPKRTRTSTRLSRTRPSTWRVYQFRHRREDERESSAGPAVSPCFASPRRCR